MRDDALHQASLPNGVRALALHLPHAATAQASVFIASGSGHESRAQAGIGHVVEHMVYKGSATRDARRINLDAERLGAEVNAHTDKDHTAFHLQGLPVHAERLVALLADLVLAPTFPADELERERRVLLEEFTEDEDDPMAMAYRLFDHACYGLHPLARPPIGERATIERLTRADLAAWVARQYTAANTVVAVAGPLDPQALLRAIDRDFAPMTSGTAHAIAAPAWRGGLRARRLDAGRQTHLVAGYPLPGRVAEDPAGELAAMVFGEGMSSPLMDELRERRGLVYYAACAADTLATSAEFVVEASFAPERLDELLTAVVTLLRRHSDAVDAGDLERGRHQLAVRWLQQHERAGRRLEAAAIDLLTLGRVCDLDERMTRLHAIDAASLQALFAGMQQRTLAAALTGHLARGAAPRARDRLAPLLRG